MNRNDSKGGFPLSRNFHVRTHVSFTRVNKIKAIYGKSGVNVKVEPRSILFTRVKFTCVNTCKLRDSGNLPYS